MRRRTLSTAQQKRSLVYSTKFNNGNSGQDTSTQTTFSKTSGMIAKVTDRLSADLLFSAFTADIIKQNTLFTR